MTINRLERRTAILKGKRAGAFDRDQYYLERAARGVEGLDLGQRRLAQELADALSAKGISIDEDTVRKWLKDAGDEVDISSSNQADKP